MEKDNRLNYELLEKASELGITEITPEMNSGDIKKIIINNEISTNYARYENRKMKNKSALAKLVNEGLREGSEVFFFYGESTAWGVVTKVSAEKGEVNVSILNGEGKYGNSVRGGSQILKVSPIPFEQDYVYIGKTMVDKVKNGKLDTAAKNALVSYEATNAKKEVFFLPKKFFKL